MRIGIFGGTFDPPHLGHLTLAEEAQAQLHLVRVIWVITPYPPHKENQDITPIQDRIVMLKAALNENPIFILSKVDIDRPPPYYAVDTVQLIRQENPTYEYIYLMGEDSLRDLLTWHSPKDFLDSCDGIGVMRRPGISIDLAILEQELPGLSVKIHHFQTPLISISSFDIRRRIAQGKPFRQYLPPAVFNIINERRLYL
jgi:nicotinate-nucleotide adenylyltransferase